MASEVFNESVTPDFGKKIINEPGEKAYQMIPYLQEIATGGHPGSKPGKKTSGKSKKSSGGNAWGEATSTVSGASLTQQAASVNQESYDVSEALS